MGGKSIKFKYSYSDAVRCFTPNGSVRRKLEISDDFRWNLHRWMWMREERAIHAMQRYLSETPSVGKLERTVIGRLLKIAECRNHLKLVFEYAIIGNFSSVSRRMRCDVKTVRAAWRRLGDDIRGRAPKKPIKSGLS